MEKIMKSKATEKERESVIIMSNVMQTNQHIIIIMTDKRVHNYYYFGLYNHN